MARSSPLSRRRPLLLLCAAVAFSVLSVPSATAGPSAGAATGPAAGAAAGPSGTAAIRTAMTWSAVGQSGGYTHFGGDAQTNPYAGDTPIDQYLPILCLLVDGRPAPAGIPFDFYNGWARGAAKATAAVRGDVLTSQQRGDEVCAENFGAGWRLAEFHDGRYGPGFESSGGWSFWAAAGTLMPGARYWVAIADQPANAWNAAGDLPTPVDVPPNDLLVKTRLQEIVQPLLGYARDPRFRNLVNAGVALQLDGDTDMLLSELVKQAESAQLVNPGDAAWQSVTSTISYLQGLGGGYDPQIYIPNHGDGAVAGPDVHMVLTETDLNRTDVPAYYVDAAGTLRLKDGLVNEDYSELHELWVLSISEGPDTGDPAEAAAFEAAIHPAGSTAAGSTASNSTAAGARTQGNCTANGVRMNRGEEYLQKFMLPSVRAVESWLAGKVELRVAIIGKGGVVVKNNRFPKIKRKKLKNSAWFDANLFITTWDRVELGNYWAYQWYEIDSGPHLSSISLNFSAAWKQKLEITAGVSVTISLEERHKDIGASLVGFLEPTTIEYQTSFIHWYVCSVGGVEENLAILATASASSTYPFEPYSPDHVNDGSRSTAMSPLESWSNADRFAPGGLLPQWVQLDFGTPVTFNTVVVYTSQGYPIQNYEIQILNASGAWQRISIRTGNTSLMIVHQLAQSYTVRFVRIFGTRGPNIQPQHVRVNEFEIYNH